MDSTTSPSWNTKIQKMQLPPSDNLINMKFSEKEWECTVIITPEDKIAKTKDASIAKKQDISPENAQTTKKKIKKKTTNPDPWDNPKNKDNATTTVTTEKEIKDNQEISDNNDQEIKEIRETQEIREIREIKEIKEIREILDTGNKESRDS